MSYFYKEMKNITVNEGDLVQIYASGTSSSCVIGGFQIRASEADFTTAYNTY